MITKEEVAWNFTPAVKLSDVQKTSLLRLEIAFKDLSAEVFELLPPGSFRELSLGKILEAKFMCAHTITHAEGKGNGSEKTKKIT